MIIRMVRVRIAGRRALLDRTLALLQDLCLLHVDRPHLPDAMGTDSLASRERRHVERCLLDVETALDRLHIAADSAPVSQPISLRQAIRRARRVRRRADALAVAAAALEDERILLVRYREFFAAFESLVGHELAWPDQQAFYVILHAGSGAALTELRQRLETTLGGEVEVLHRELSSGEMAVLILASSRTAPRVSGLLSASRVEEVPVPTGIGEQNLVRALPAIKNRLADIPRQLRAVEAERQALAESEGAWLCSRRVMLRDQLLRLNARARVFSAKHVFVIEGWLPRPSLADLEHRLQNDFGPEVVVSTVGLEDRASENTPVALHNPPIFRPFEVFTRALPLPKYGTIDPTPFIAVFFPAFFGLMLGDVGYGLLLVLIAVFLRFKSSPDTTLRSVATVALACASSAITFGLVFGEFFGSLGRLVGLRPFFDRAEATIPFLALTVALGAVHVVLGAILSVFNQWQRGHRREAMGRGVALWMLILITLALLAAFEVLPSALFTPLTIAIFVGFTVLVALEGVVAVIELVSTLGRVLSYARIMALGTASLMLAIVANEMVGAMGSVLVGAVFALLFHLVNFAIGLFSPTIHALRLHYVEFFGEFFSPGGAEYRPLGHWHSSQ
ncbi:MAG TPA: V-type ATPase 116kDa subunit family protein [Vicinamibacterales bacterium]|nr:V-type ATPase 116kDa subunit family protein [Vicinamibacterales bacterium]